MHKAPQRIKVGGHTYVRADRPAPTHDAHESIARARVLQKNAHELAERFKFYSSILGETIFFANKDIEQAGVHVFANKVINAYKSVGIDQFLSDLEKLINEFRELQKVGKAR
jgi:hypothetical protein